MRQVEGHASTCIALAVLEALQCGDRRSVDILAQTSGSSEKATEAVLSRLARRGVPLRMNIQGWILDGSSHDVTLILWAAASTLPLYEAAVLLEFIAGSRSRAPDERAVWGG